jgi:preprotein translocase subunit SecG
MIIVFVIVLVLACIILGFIVLVQNPKGGGLAANIGGISNQFMGVKQTNDVLEKGTWVFAALIAVLCLFSVALIPSSTTSRENLLDKINAKPTTTNTAPAPMPVTPQPPANK